MVSVCGVIVRSEVDEHVVIIEWNFFNELEQTWERREMTKITVMPDDNRAGFN
jgi:hypothetical protein